MPDQITWPSYALFHNGKQISKSHPAVKIVMIEASERGAVINWVADWSSDRPGTGLALGYEIREVSNA